MGWEGCPGQSCVLLCNISLGEGIWGPCGVDLKLRRRSLRDLPEELAVSKAVLIVLICHSIKPFDLGQWGDEVIWSIQYDARNFWRASDENGGPLSEKQSLEGPYWEIKFCNCLMEESADLEEV